MRYSNGPEAAPGGGLRTVAAGWTRSRAGRAAGVTAAAAIGLALLAACGSIGGQGPITMSGSAGPADAGTPTASASATTGSTGTSTTATTKPATGTTPAGGTTTAGNNGHGCPAGGASIPAGAGTATTADLDGDGRADTVWLADKGDRRVLGVRTATGAGFSTTFSSAAPQSATAVAGRLGDGSAVILLDLSRETKLYAVVNCTIVASRNAQGDQYTFDQGFTGYGTGAGCPSLGSSGRHLVGYLAKPNSDGSRFRVVRTTISLSANGARAKNSTTTVLGRSLPSSSAVVKLAQSVTCGTGARAYEPES